MHAKRTQPTLAAGRTRKASPRALAVIGAAAALAVLAVVLGIVLGGGKSAPGSDVPAVGSLVNALPGAGDVQAMFKGIPQNGMTLGSALAPVAIAEYVDVQCPACRQAETDMLPGIVARYVRTGKAKLVLRPLAFVGPDSVRGRDALLAAARQNRAFNFLELLYVNQGTENAGWLTDDMVTQAASSIPGMRVQDLLTLRDDSSISKQAAQADAIARAAGINSTPTFVVAGAALIGPSADTLSSAIERALP
jgi:protein-disulfide isomerase